MAEINGQETLSVKEAARWLGVNLARVYKLIEESRLAAVEGEGPKRVTARSLLTFRDKRDWWKALHGQKKNRRFPSVG